MKINWGVRFKNKNFWITIIPTVSLVMQFVASIFGVDIELGNLGDTLLAIINSVFGLLAILGIVTDPTTSGVSDSEQAMTYNEPQKG